MANSKTLLLFSDFFPVNLVKLANPGDVPVMYFLHSLDRLPAQGNAQKCWSTPGMKHSIEDLQNGICHFSLPFPCLELWDGKGSQISLLK